MGLGLGLGLGLGAGEGLDLVVLDDPDLVAHRADEGDVVRDHHDAALELLERRDERVHRLEVEVVGRLVEEQQVRALEPELHEDHARLLAAW